jgi:hypothetical protein
MLKKVTVIAAFALVAAVTGEASALLPAYRCWYDQLDNTNALARRQWAQAGRNANPYNFTVNGALAPDYRFWDSTYTADATAYANQIPAVQVYPGYVDPNNGYAVWKPAQVITVNTPFTTKPAAVFMDGICMGGCYTPDQAILFDEGEVPIERAMSEGLPGLLTLTSDSTAESLSFFKNTVDFYLADKVAAEQDILFFRTQSGGELKVTLEHPLLSEDGTIRSAKQFQAGDSLVREDGSPDVIRSIEEQKQFVKAYNLQPVTTDKVSNILVAQGFLNGSLRYQHQWVEDANRALLRKNVPDDVIPVR